MDYNKFCSSALGIGAGLGALFGAVAMRDASVALTGKAYFDLVALGAAAGVPAGIINIAFPASFIPDIVNRYGGRHDDFRVDVGRAAWGALVPTSIATAALIGVDDRSTPEILFDFAQDEENINADHNLRLEAE